MDPRTRRIGSIAAVALAVVVVFSAAFVALDFDLVRSSETTVERSVATASVGGAGSGLTDRVYVHVVGEMDPATLAALTADLESRGVTATPVASLAPDYDAPLLVLVEDDRGFEWTPFVLSADLSWRYLYSDAGNGTRLAEYVENPDAVKRFSSEDEDRYLQTAEFHLVDRTTGVVSLPGYDRYLAERVGNETATVLWETTR